MPVVAFILNKFSLEQAKQAKLLTQYTNSRWEGQADVRRPTRGIQLKNDTYATLQVIKGDGKEIPLVNAGSRVPAQGEEKDDKLRSKINSNFLIQAVTEERMEKQQVVETFGESFIFFFGERPRVISIQGVLLNTFDFNWEAEWWYNYEHYLRGTKCVESDARVFLTYDDTLVSGYIISTSSSKNAQEKNQVGFQFQLFVTDYTQISKVGDPSPDQAKEMRYDGLQAKLSDKIRYGPMVLPYRRSGALIGAMSLTESLLRTGMEAVRYTMSTARQIANAALMPAAYLDQFLGNPVRVPIGFQGAVALDETLVDLNKYLYSNIKATGLDNPIRYTTNFGHNTDEFVWMGAYERSRINMNDQDWAFKRGASIGSTEAVLSAEKQWRAYGLIPPNDAMSNMLSRVVTNPIGMMIVGSARNWLATKGAQVSSKMNQAVDMAVPFAAGAQTVLGTAAVVDNLVGAVSPAASQAIDRALPASAAAVNSGFQSGVTQAELAKQNSINSFKGFANSAAAYVVGGG